MMRIKNANGELLYAPNLLLFKNLKTGKTVSFSGGNEFILYVQTEKGICVLPDTEFLYKGIEETDTGFSLSYEKDGIAVKVCY